jgi:hypothetical protein
MGRAQVASTLKVDAAINVLAEAVGAVLVMAETRILVAGVDSRQTPPFGVRFYGACASGGSRPMTRCGGSGPILARWS